MVSEQILARILQFFYASEIAGIVIRIPMGSKRVSHPFSRGMMASGKSEAKIMRRLVEIKR